MRNTVTKILRMKKANKKIVMLTAYDYPFARILDEAQADIVLIGDSLANVALGLDATKKVGMPEMLHHAKAVSRAVKNALVVADMPYSAYQTKPNESVKNAKRFIREANCDAVKIEWFKDCAKVTGKLVKAKIKVMGHVGLTPQTVKKFKVRGSSAIEAKKIIAQAKMFEDEGCFAIVLECIPGEVAKIITKELRIPTIGIGAGKYCDGQVLVSQDFLGLFDRFHPRFVKQYVNLSAQINQAVNSFSREVRTGKFPDAKHSYTMDERELKKI